jgi:hypothetical protein
MDIPQLTSTIPSGMLRHKIVLRQNPPGPVAFTATDTTQTIFLFGTPPKHVVVGVVARLVLPFVAVATGGLNVCNAMLGATSQLDGTFTTTNYYMPSFSCTQSVTPPHYPIMYWTPFAMFTTDPQDIKATFQSTGAQLASITAGEIEFTIMYRAI